LAAGFALLLAHFVIEAIADFIGPQLPLTVQIGLDGWFSLYVGDFHSDGVYRGIGAIVAFDEGKSE